MAAGPGTLSLLAAELGHQVTAIDFSREMVERLRAASTARQVKIDAKVGDGMALELPADRFQAAFSLFGLIFFPNRARGFSELYRVLKPGGRAVVASWVPVDQMPMLATVFSTLTELLPVPMAPPPRVLETPEACVTEMASAGFSDVTVQAATFAFEAPSLKEYWAWFPASCAPLSMLPKLVGEETQVMLQKIYARVEERFGSGPVRVEMPALLTSGTKT